MRILGIDPGLATVGIGLIESSSPHDVRAVEWLTIRTASGTPAPDRLREIAADLSAFLAETNPDLAVVEKLFFAKNEGSALDVAQARGVLLLTLRNANIPILEPTPLELKLCITGDGRADKKQMQSMIVRLLNLKEIPQPDDAADALALGVFGALRRSALSDSPVPHPKVARPAPFPKDA